MKICVTGATGFLGYRLIQRLQSLGHEVLATGRNKHMGEKITYLGLPFKRGSLEDRAFVMSLIPDGTDAVIHCAGLASPWGPYESFYQANVVATEHVIEACLARGVKRLVHVSTPSIYVEYKDKFDVKESDPLPIEFVTHYAKTKYLAEQKVFEAHQKGLETLMIRPRALVGAGDTVIMPRLLRAHHEGRLRVIGDGKNQVDLTPVSNVIDALILCLNAPEDALGEAYNISNGQPVKLWDFLKAVFAKMHLTLNEKRIPFGVAYGVAKSMEQAAKLLPEQPEPPLTCYGVGMLAKTQTLNIDKARQKLGYEPQQSLDEAVDEFLTWWQQTNWVLL